MYMYIVPSFVIITITLNLANKNKKKIPNYKKKKKRLHRNSIDRSKSPHFDLRRIYCKG
jgi:hypothetical protein